MKRVVLVLFFMVFNLYAQKLPFCNELVQKSHSNKELLKEKTMCKVSLLDIYPTQAIIGKVAVDCKAKEIEKTLRKDYHDDEKDFRKDYLCEKKNFLPIVVGYKDRLYITDHHHFSSAVLESSKIDKKELNAFILHDYSHNENWQEKSEDEFWNLMKNENLVYLKKFGKDISWSELPTSLTRLENDPFRTLSKWVRESGCYSKEKDKDRDEKVCDEKEFSLSKNSNSTYYQEFIYADKLRDKFSSEFDSKNEVKSLIEIYPKAIKFLGDECEKKKVDEGNFCKKLD